MRSACSRLFCSLLGSCVLLAGLFLCSAPTPGQDKSPPRSVGVPYALSSDALKSLEGKPVKIQLKNGKVLEGYRIAKVRVGREEGVLGSIQIEADSGRKRTLRPGAIAALEVDGTPFAVAKKPGKSLYVLIDLEARNQAIAARLKQQGGRLWPPLSPAQQQKALAEQRRFVRQVLSVFPGVHFEVVETKFFIFCTNIRPQLIAGYVRDLDRMYTMLCGIFQIPPGTNIFRGKAVVFCFATQQERAVFEGRFLNSTPTGTAGKCFQRSDGNVVISSHLVSDLDFFGHVLVHETAHGVIWRYRSSMRIPTWMNEGIADWVAMKVVPRCRETQRRQQAAAERLRRTHNLEGLFVRESLDGWQYGAASAIVQMLIELDSRRFGAMFEAIKLGTHWEDALASAYGMTLGDLIAMYGKRIGVPLLRP